MQKGIPYQSYYRHRIFTGIFNYPATWNLLDAIIHSFRLMMTRPKVYPRLKALRWQAWEKYLQIGLNRPPKHNCYNLSPIFHHTASVEGEQVFLANNQAPDWLIKTIGRWKSQAFQLYTDYNWSTILDTLAQCTWVTPMGKSQTLGETDTKSQRRSQTQKQMLNSGAGYNQGCNQVDIKSYQHTLC